MYLQPYLFFNGRCDEALEFYERVLGASIDFLMRYKDSPEAPQSSSLPPGHEQKVMHASVRIGESVIMVSDGLCDGSPVFQGFALSLALTSAGDVERIFTALREEGQVQMPLATTFFSERFGMVTDRFGVTWMVMVATPQEPGMSTEA
jgi:PhnB protein